MKIRIRWIPIALLSFLLSTALLLPAGRAEIKASGFTLTVENVGTVSGVPGLDASYIVVRIPDGLPAGDLPLTVTLRGVTSNTATLGISP